jgi:hypothetical protein
VIILVVLPSILFELVLVRAHTFSPVNNTSTNSNDSSGYTTWNIRLATLMGNQYYSKGDDGTRMHFSAKNILSDKKIHVHDKVIVYFDKNNLGKGLISKSREEIISQGAVV